MRKRVSSRLTPWGPYIMFLMFGPTFVLSGAALMEQGARWGAFHLLSGLGVCCIFLMSPKPKFIEYDDKYVYIKGCGANQRVALENVDAVQRLRTGFVLLLNGQTRFGTKVFFVLPVSEVLTMSFGSKDLLKEGLLREFTDAVQKRRAVV